MAVKIIDAITGGMFMTRGGVTAKWIRKVIADAPESFEYDEERDRLTLIQDALAKERIFSA